MSAPDNTHVVLHEDVLQNGVFLVICNVEASVNTSALMVMSLTDEITSYTARGTMAGGGGLFVEMLIDAREKDKPISIKCYHNNTTTVNMYTRYSRIRLI